MRNVLVLTVLALSIAGAGPSVAQPQVSQSQPLSLATIAERLETDGYRVVEIERDHGLVEVKARDPQGVCVELHLDPETAEIVRRESDDDCGAGGRRG